MLNRASDVVRPSSGEVKTAEGSVTSLVLDSKLEEFCRVAASNDHPVLLLGETGVGKTQLARSIHLASNRRRGPFVRVNCGAIPRDLFEREMFGNVRGAFTDAKESRPGLFEAANGGSLLLDEVGELPLEAQTKLLTAIEEHSIRRVGAISEIPVDVRIIAATNCDLRARMGTGQFRQDLYYRCAVLVCEVPPLRERHQEFGAILSHLVWTIAGRDLRSVLSPGAISVLREHGWPGNFRELENVLKQATLRADGGIVRRHHIVDSLNGAKAVAADMPVERTRKHRYEATGCFEDEKARIQAAMAAENGNQTRAARRLGMARSTLWVRMKLFQLLPQLDQK